MQIHSILKRTHRPSSFLPLSLLSLLLSFPATIESPKHDMLRLLANTDTSSMPSRKVTGRELDRCCLRYWRNRAFSLRVKIGYSTCMLVHAKYSIPNRCLLCT